MEKVQSELAKYLEIRLLEVAENKPLRAVAASLGYDKPNMLSMWMRGEVKVPLEKIAPLAQELNADPVHLWRLGLMQYGYNFGESENEAFLRVHTEHENVIIKLWRQCTENSDPECSKAFLDIFTKAVRETVQTEAINLESGLSTQLQDLNFKVAPSLHKRFKLEAAMRDMSMKELLEAAFDHYLRTH